MTKRTLETFTKVDKTELLEEIKNDNSNAITYLDEQFDIQKPLIALKDIHVQKEIPTSAASSLLKGNIYGYDSEVVKKLKTAGYQLFMRTNLDEFAMGSSSITSTFGKVHSAYSETDYGGGSSGGSAYVVAKGYAPIATGTDTGGSVRQPAALNGIYGFKPTYGVISRYGTIAFASSFDTVGLFANKISDIQTVFKDLAGTDYKDQTSYCPEDFWLKPKKTVKKVAYLKEWQEADIDGSIAKELQTTYEQLQAQGIEVVEVSIPEIKMSVELYVALAYAEASSNLSRYDGIRYGNVSSETEQLFLRARKLFGSEVKKRILIGAYALSSDNFQGFYEQAQKIRKIIKDKFAKIFEDYDFIIGPTVPKTSLPMNVDVNSYEAYLYDLFVIPANLASLPAISIPRGHDDNGKPVAIQLVAKSYDDVSLLNFAQELGGSNE